MSKREDIFGREFILKGEDKFPHVEGESDEQMKEKREYDYEEREGFRAGDNCFCCQSCGYMERRESSPTGYYCTLGKFYDKPSGCCIRYEIREDLKR